MLYYAILCYTMLCHTLNIQTNTYIYIYRDDILALDRVKRLRKATKAKQMIAGHLARHSPIPPVLRFSTCSDLHGIQRYPFPLQSQTTEELLAQTLVR